MSDTGIELDLGNAQNWEDVYSGKFEAERVSDDRFIPFGKIDIPILLDRPVFAVYIESPPAPANWRGAGWLNQKVRVGLTVGGSQEGNRNTGRFMLLDEVMVVEWPPITESFQVVFSPRRRLQEVNIRIWKYTGPITQSISEKVDLARIDILRVEKQVQFIAKRDVETDYRVE